MLHFLAVQLLNASLYISARAQNSNLILGLTASGKPGIVDRAPEHSKAGFKALREKAMGAYLSQPILEKETEDGENGSDVNTLYADHENQRSREHGEGQQGERAGEWQREADGRQLSLCARKKPPVPRHRSPCFNALSPALAPKI